MMQRTSLTLLPSWAAALVSLALFNAAGLYSPRTSAAMPVDTVRTVTIHAASSSATPTPLGLKQNLDGDTCQSRILTTLFADGTLMEYHIKPVCHTSGARNVFLRLSNDTLADYPSNYIRTENFYIAGPRDSVWFSRKLYFNNQHLFDRVQEELQFATTNEARNRIFREAYDGAEYGPADSIFPRSGEFEYITELRRASDGDLLWSDDTLRCYLNSNGKLRYSTAPHSLPLRLIVPPTTAYGDSVYLHVRIVRNVPPSVMLTYRSHTSRNNRLIKLMPLFISDWQEDSTEAELNSKVTDTTHALTLTDLRATATRKNLTLRFVAEHAGAGFLEITRPIGSILRTKLLDCVAGKNTYALPLTDLLPGTYIARLSTATTATSSKFVVH